MLNRLKSLIHKVYFHHIIDITLLQDRTDFPTSIKNQYWQLKIFKTLFLFILNRILYIKYQYTYHIAASFNRYSLTKDYFIYEDFETNIITWLKNRNIDYSFKIPMNIKYENALTKINFKITEPQSILTFFCCCDSPLIINHILNQQSFKSSDIEDSINCMASQNIYSEEIYSILNKTLLLLDKPVNLIAQTSKRPARI